MGRNPWEDVDPDLAALGVRRSSFSWGRFFVGLLLVGCVTVIAAYYLPLYRAHQALASDHQRVVDKAQGLERQAVELRGQLGRAESKVSSLEAERERASTPAAPDEAANRLKSELLAKLDKPVKKGAAAVGAESGRVIVALADSVVFAPKKLDVSAQGKALLCDVAKASGGHALRVAALDANEKPAAPLSKTYPTAWSLRAARAGSAAEYLEDSCGVAATRLVAQAVGKERTASAFGSDKLPSTRIEIEVVTKPGG